MAITATLYSDPGCPWAYSANPAFAVLRWRYGRGLAWRLVTIGLTENAEQYVRRGYTPSRSTRAYLHFRRYGMPFATEPRQRIAATGRACRAIVAVRLLDPEREYAAYRALQFGWFTSSLVLDEDDQIARALAAVPGLDAEAVLASLDSGDVAAAYEADRNAARKAGGSPTEFQGKARNTDGAVRYSAPSVVFNAGERSLEAGGFQPVEAYDVLIANLDRRLARAAPPQSPLEALERLDFGLTTQEVAAVMTHGNDAPDRARAEEALIDLVSDGSVARLPLGDDALWVARSAARPHAGETAVAA